MTNLFVIILAVLDGFGVYGNFLHYAFVLSFVGSAFMIFLYLWKNGKLDMDEEPKMQMLRSEDDLWEKEKKDE